MGLGNRSAKRHETAASRKVAANAEDYWDFKPGQTVMTVDGFLGKVTSVWDGPLPGLAEYEVTLHNAMGGGTYMASQLTAATDHSASMENTAAIDYPELAQVLQERPDIGKYPHTTLGMVASLHTAGNEAYDEDENHQCEDDGSGRCGECGEEVYDPHGSHYYNSGSTQRWSALVSEQPVSLGYYTEAELRAAATEGQQPSLCDNGHLMWGGECAGCNERDPGAHDTVINPGDHKPNPAEMGHAAAWTPQDPATYNTIDGCRICGDSEHSDDYHPWDPKGGNVPPKREYPVRAHTAAEETPQPQRKKTITADPAEAPSRRVDAPSLPEWPDLRPLTPEEERELGSNPQGPTKYSSVHTAQWKYDQHPEPITHAAGTPPQRPLQTGDSLLYPGGFATQVTAHSPSLLQIIGPNGQPRTMHRGPIEGNFKDSISSSDSIAEANKDVPPMSDAQRAFMDSNGSGPTKYSSNPNGWRDGTAHEYQMGYQGDRDYDDECDDPRCVNGQQAFHTVGEHIDPDDPYNDENMDVKKHLDGVFNTPDHEYGKTLLDQQEQGPSKYSALDLAYRVIAHAGADADLRFQITAAWRDVRAKAQRLRREGAVKVTYAERGYYIASVRGDSAEYESVILRAPASQKVGAWDCSCPWGKYNWNSDGHSKYAGRMCSHALALFFESQANSTRHRDDRLTSHSSLGTVEALSPLQVMARFLVASGEDREEVALLLSTLGSVNSPFGEPEASVPQMQGPTMPPNHFENPASAGPLSAEDPASWGQAQVPGLDRMGARESIPGLGCPHCTDGFYTMDARERHIREQHPGEYSGPDQEMSDLLDMRPELKRQSSLDDALFEPDMPHTAGPALLLPELLGGVAEAGGAAAEAGTAAGAASEAGEGMGSSILRNLPTPSSHQNDDDDDNSTTATLHESPEAALPSTDGTSFDDGALGDTDASTMNTIAVNTGVGYMVPGDDSASSIGESISPGMGIKDTTDDALSPEDPSIQTVGSIEEIVAQFQRTAGAQAINAGSPDSGEIARMAMETLAGMSKTAMADFTHIQQQELINEGEHSKAANLDRLQIEGTHYEPLEHALAAQDNEEEWLA